MDQLFAGIKFPEETYQYYFYTMSFASVTKYLLYGSFAPFLNKHFIVCFSNLRLILIPLDPVTGNPTLNVVELPISEVSGLSLKKGFFKTKITLNLSDGTIIKFNPNNICIGLSNHKANLTKLADMYA
ncbi:hypothetical protein [Paenibacillus sp. NEAU-GSW1]|uniref:hypothetical protein n=1 Tax=Paenibacillus sp. NEAU-GSW1 TaxID=2682486 RepID=UPI001565FE2E|nr:hypothetical protein [Paenibacillus sp. NEAU-GSW1]